MAGQKIDNAVDHCANLRPVAVVVVHDDPLPLTQFGNFLASTLQQRIAVSRKAWQHAFADA